MDRALPSSSARPRRCRDPARPGYSVHEVPEFGGKAVGLGSDRTRRRTDRVTTCPRRIAGLPTRPALQHWLEIEGRPADHLEHVGGGSLLLQRLAELVEQAGILDGDDGLRGEIRDQPDLLVGERIHVLPIDRHADQLSLLDHRHHERCAAGRPRRAATGRARDEVGRISSEVGDVLHLPGSDNASKGATPDQDRNWIADRHNSSPAGGAPCMAATRKALPSYRKMAKLASHMRVAFASMAWNTGSNSPGELLMTLSTSAVAVCCCSDLAATR